MSKKIAKRLTIGVETIRKLSSVSLDAVVGGAEAQSLSKPIELCGSIICSHKEIPAEFGGCWKKK